ncbi:glycosyl hydrolase family 28-related protein [Paenibacillus polymyxa]|uniref:glycosyl hydrolase family 28-related protein n=1 Tax=Paenibacillus polymyxa TaxID=1406 RepID=UPI002378A9F3|nr:glycosyl hydrolase family 28-related protein [Paenibacillus polymyxa]WDM22651.1 hypothetical protein J4I02_03250 [Paenibacillus polymyxa]
MTSLPWRNNTSHDISSQVNPRYETPKGAQDKADKAEQNAKQYADDNFAKNAFKTIKVDGMQDIVADDKEDVLTIEGRTGISVTTNPLSDKLILTATGDAIPGEHGSSHLSDGADPIPDATDTTSGLLSPAEKIAIEQHSIDISNIEENIDDLKVEITTYVKKNSLILNVMDFGAKGDGITDDTLSIQTAINYCAQMGGGIVYLPPGTYLISSTLQIKSSNVTLCGSGHASRILGNFVTGNIIYAGRSSLVTQAVVNVGIKDLSIASTVKKTSGAAIFCELAERFNITGVYASPAEDDNYNLYDGLYFKYFDNCVVDRVYLSQSHNGITMFGMADQSWGANLFICGGSKIIGNHLNGSTGIYIGGSAGGINVEDTDIIKCDINIHINSNLSTKENREIFLNQCFVDSAGNHGILINDNGVVYLHMTGTWIASSGSVSSGGFPNGNNIQTTSVQSGRMDVIMIGCRVFNAYGSGLVLNAGRWTITGCSVHTNGRGAAGGHGVNVINPNVSSLVLNGNSIINNGNSTLGIGVLITSGVSNYIVTNNNVQNNGTTGISDNGASNKIVSNNLL